MRNPRQYLVNLWRLHIRLRIEPDGVTVTPYDPHGRVSPLLVEETQKRSADILPYVARYIAHQEAHCAAWEARGTVARPLTAWERRAMERKQNVSENEHNGHTESMRQGVLL